jgi:NADH-quinone oxidoreductase subunit A
MSELLRTICRSSCSSRSRSASGSRCSSRRSSSPTEAPTRRKLSAYECGFNAFDDARMKFDVRFYLVAILFIIFDLEVSFLFPWAVAFGQLGAFGFWSMMLFLGVLTIGFIYEWKKGALEWD